jgi:hypothetical protein
MLETLLNMDNQKLAWIAVNTSLGVLFLFFKCLFLLLQRRGVRNHADIGSLIFVYLIYHKDT